MVTRREVEIAVENATMDPPGRLIVMMLLGRCTFGSLWVPGRHAPSFTEFQRITGLSRSTIYDWAKALTEAGWIRKLRKDDESRDGFEVSIGNSVVTLPARSSRIKKADREPIEPTEPTTDADPAYRSAIQEKEEDHQSSVSLSGTGLGGRRIAERYAGVSLSDTEQLSFLIQDSPTESPTRTTKTSSAKPRKPRVKKTDESDDESRLVNRLTKIYTDHVKLTDFWAVRSVVKIAIRENTYTVEQLETAIGALAKNRTVFSKGTLLVALEGFQGRRNGADNGRGYQSPRVNQDEPGARKASWDRRRTNAQQ